MRTIVFDEDGPHDMGNLDVGQVHDVIADALGEARLTGKEPTMDQTLTEICENMQEHIRETYDLGHGDAQELFKEIWTKMAEARNPKPVQAAIETVSDAFSI